MSCLLFLVWFLCVLVQIHQVNASMPRHVVPPSHSETHQLLIVFDDNGDGKVDADEFADFAVFLFFRVGGCSVI